jgi:cold shock protein
MNGTVKFFNNTKGFGFIAGDDGNEYFVHQTGLGDGVSLNDNDAVEFDVEQGDRGPKAVNVKKASADSGADDQEDAGQEE